MSWNRYSLWLELHYWVGSSLIPRLLISLRYSTRSVDGAHYLANTPLAQLSVTAAVSTLEAVCSCLIVSTESTFGLNLHRQGNACHCCACHKTAFTILMSWDLCLLRSTAWREQGLKAADISLQLLLPMDVMNTFLPAYHLAVNLAAYNAFCISVH